MRLVTVASAVGLVIVGCSSNPPDAAVAATTCEALRGVNNRIVTIVNGSVSGIDALAPDGRLAPVQAGLGEVRDELEAWDEQIDELELPDVSEVEVLRAQLHDGVADALAELDDEAEALAAIGPPVPDDEVAGLVGAWFNAVEKVVSSIEPEIFRYERQEFKQAFLDEPDCRNVVQPFVND